MSCANRHSSGTSFRLLAVLAALLFVSAARADVIITTFDQFNAGDVWGPDTQVGVAVLVSSTVVNVTSVQMRQGNDTNFFTPPADETFAIYARNADGTLGSVVYQDFTMSITSTGATGTPNTPLLLGPNQGYWLVMNSGPTDTIEVDSARSHSFTAQQGVSVPAQTDPVNLAIMVNPGSGPQYGAANFNTTTQSGNPIPIFQINGTLVPEPSALSLAALLSAVGFLAARPKARLNRVW